MQKRLYFIYYANERKIFDTKLLQLIFFFSHFIYLVEYIQWVYSLEWNVKFIYWKIAFSVNIDSADSIVGVGLFCFVNPNDQKPLNDKSWYSKQVEQLKNMKNELTVALGFFSFFIPVSAIHYIVQVLFQYSIFAWFPIENFQLFIFQWSCSKASISRVSNYPRGKKCMQFAL